MAETFHHHSADVEVCRTCGTRYRVTYTSTIMRDKGKFDCDVCGSSLEYWDGSQVPSYMRLPNGAA